MSLDIIPLKINEGDIVIIKYDNTKNQQELNQLARTMAELFKDRNPVLIMSDKLDIESVDEKYLNHLGYFKRSEITREVNVMGRSVDLPLTLV